MSYTDEVARRLKEIEEEAFCLREKVKTLTDFLLANFKGDVGTGPDSLESAVGAAVRLLTELKERRRQVKVLTADLLNRMATAT